MVPGAFLFDKSCGIIIQNSSNYFNELLNWKGGWRMGQGYSYQCPQCGYSEDFNTGIGLAYEHETEEAKLEILRGTFGTKPKDYLTAHPDSEVITEQEIYHCRKCGNLEERPHITITALSHRAMTILNRCGRCSCVMGQVDAEKGLSCPECGHGLEMSTTLMWD